MFLFVFKLLKSVWSYVYFAGKRGIYTAVKLFIFNFQNTSTELIRYYREKYALKANVVWTFNHESSRRADDYFIPKLVGFLAESIRDPRFKGELYSLDAVCDWGDAKEFMNICCEVTQNYPRVDVILATGKPLVARVLARDIFNQYGLNYRNHIRVREKNSNFSISQQVDLSVLNNQLKLSATRDVYDVLRDILDHNYSYI